jgi:hypothetical protein
MSGDVKVITINQSTLCFMLFLSDSRYAGCDGSCILYCSAYTTFYINGTRYDGSWDLETLLKTLTSEFN